MKILVKFAKLGNAIYISHLDLLRSVQRNFKRAGLPIRFSQGYNPRPVVSFAQALSLGMESIGEYFQAEFVQDVDIPILIESFNEHAPEGIELLKAREMKKHEKNPMAVVRVADYEITVQEDIDKIKMALEDFLQRDIYIYERKGKGGVRKNDMRGMVISAHMQNDKLFCRLSCGSENLAIVDFCTTLKKLAQSETQCIMKRIDMLREDGRGGYVSLIEE